MKNFTVIFVQCAFYFLIYLKVDSIIKSENVMCRNGP